MEVGVKYCGGCNPRYDRPAVLNKLKKKYSDVNFSYASEDKETDLLIVICGCTAACADYSKLKSKNGIVVIDDEKGIEKISQAIDNLIK